jgi:hypothetical protein
MSQTLHIDRNSACCCPCFAVTKQRSVFSHIGCLLLCRRRPGTGLTIGLPKREQIENIASDLVDPASCTLSLIIAIMLCRCRYHLITGPVLACWHVIKDCAARVINEIDHNAAPEGQVEKEDNDKPDTTLSIVRAALDDGRRLIGLQIEEGNVEYVVSELRRQHEIGWGEVAQQDQHQQLQPVEAAGAGQAGYSMQPLEWNASANLM